MRLRCLLAVVGATIVLVLPATASADLMTSVRNAIEGSKEPVPGGRGDLGFKSEANPCRPYFYDAGRQAGYAGVTDGAETWKQIGRPPTLLPPGTFWEKDDDEGFFPTEKDAVEAIPAGVTSVPRGAASITSLRWTAIPSGRLTPYQPETTLACSGGYTMDYAGPWSPVLSKGAQATAICRDARGSTPFVQWIQDLERDTPALFEGLAADKVLMKVLGEALKGGGGKAGKTLLVNTFKELWGGKPSNLLGLGFVQAVLSAALDGYMEEIADEVAPLSNAVWDYSVLGGNLWAYWAPAKSRMTSGELAINIVSPNPASSHAAIFLACSSAPAIQGNVLNLKPKIDPGMRVREEVHGPAYYGTPLSNPKRPVLKAGASASSMPVALASSRSRAAGETVIGKGKKKLVVATGPGDDEVFGSAANDILRAGSGNDKVIGGPGADKLFGGSGNDLLVDRSAAPNTFVGGPGTDRIDARHKGDRPAKINCGPGEDIVLASPGDRISASCEHVFFSLEEAPHDLDDALGQPRNWPR